MNQRILTVLFFLLLIYSQHTIYAQVDTSSLSEKFRSSKDKSRREIAFALAKDGKLLYKKETGEFGIKSKYPIGVTSQWLTAALVMTFVDEGKLSLDDKVSAYLPIFAKHLKGYITIRHCLSNFTGIENEGSISKLLQKTQYTALQWEVESYAAEKEIQTNAGTEFRYSNMGFNIAGRILEVISKKNFDRIMQDRIFRGCGMKSSTFTNENYEESVSPARGCYSTVSDLVNFMTMLLNKGSFNGKQVLAGSSVEELLKMHAEANVVKYTPKTTEGMPYGLGAWIFETTPSGKPQTVGVPGLTGVWPLMDICHGYAFVLISKGAPADQKKDEVMSLKGMIDDQLAEKCE